ncbi:MAG: hypothetical protein HUU37_00435 [Bdellovibrionales bacterium]|nr:hypothetical protein [Bdellovibrionales bacterium]
MRGTAMRRVCTRLAQEGESLAQFRALEFFAREGDWQTIVYFPKVGSLDAWEIDPAFRSAMEQNLPGAKIRIGNSFEIALHTENQGVFDFLVFDNPMGLYGPNGEYCEHFEALTLVPRLMSRRAWVIFNVNWRPIDYKPNSAWGRRRQQFYGREAAGALEFSWLFDHYDAVFGKMGLRVLRRFSEKRAGAFVSYFVYELERC